MNSIFFSQAGNRIQILDSDSFSNLSEGDLSNRLWTSLDIECGGTYYVIDLDGAKFKERTEKKEEISAPAIEPKQNTADREYCGIIPVMTNRRLVQGTYHLYIKYVGDDERYQIRDGNGKIYFVMRNQYTSTDHNSLTSTYGWQFVFDGDKFFNVR